MYNYKIKNPERVEKEIDGLLSFPMQKNKIKQCLFEKVISDVKENCDYLSPETLFSERSKEYGVWFHTIDYLEFKENVARYDTFIIYQCHLDDLRQTVEIILK